MPSLVFEHHVILPEVLRSLLVAGDVVEDGAAPASATPVNPQPQPPAKPARPARKARR